MLARPLLALLLLVGSCGFIPAMSGCAAALPFIHTIATVVADVTGALEQARSVVESHPGIDPAAKAAALEAIRRATILRDAVKAAAEVADSVDDREYLSAVESLLVAVREVYALCQPFGLQAAPALERRKLGASRPGHVLVPTVDELRAGLVRR